jgi:hypothetical protein
MKATLIAAVFATALFAQEPARDVHVITEDIAGTATPGVQLGERVFRFGNAAGTFAQSMEIVSGIGIGPTVVKAPYAAEAVNESIQTLYDGNRIVERSFTKQYRDSEGRERREEGEPMNAVFISDPVAKLSYTLHPQSKSAEKVGYNRGAQMTTLSSSINGSIHITRAAPGSIGPLLNGIATRQGGKTEDLGNRMIEGVEARGTRTTTTIPAGEIGNDRAIDIIDENWFSPELQLTVLTRHADPRTGESTYKLVNIQRIEQVRSLFEVPSNYTLQEGPTFNRLKEE